MNNIFRCKFGSHLYGTSTPSSDVDYKGIYIPKARDILLGRVKQTITHNTKQEGQLKNTKDDIDTEVFSLCRYLKLLSQGQTVSLDMLFCPKEMTLETSDIWNTIQLNKDKLVTSKIESFVGYTKQQASKYGVKGFRIAAFKVIIEHLRQYPAHIQLEDCELEKVYALNNAYIFMEERSNRSGHKESYVNVGGKLAGYKNKVLNVLAIYERMYQEYGERARLAEKNEGIDYKAMSHAIRVAQQAEELLLTGNIVFPLKEKDYILKVKKGELPYAEISAKIEEGLERIKEASLKSTLRKEPDYDWIDSFVENVYGDTVKGIKL